MKTGMMKTDLTRKQLISVWVMGVCQCGVIIALAFSVNAQMISFICSAVIMFLVLVVGDKQGENFFRIVQKIIQA